MFSIGFGSPLLSKTDSKGTEWVFSAIPLGGYVTMWDHLNSKSKDSIFDVKSSYSNQSFFRVRFRSIHILLSIWILGLLYIAANHIKSSIELDRKFLRLCFKLCVFLYLKINNRYFTSQII